MEVTEDLAVRYEGEGHPILLIHGWTMQGCAEAADFEPIFENTTGYRRIYIDLPGMGHSLGNGVQNLDDIYKRIRDFVSNNISTNFLITGSSCGAYLARALAFEFSSRVDGLLLRVPLVEPRSSKRDVDPFSPVIANGSLMKMLSAQDHENMGDIPVQTAEYIEALRLKTEKIYQPAISAADATVLDPIRNDDTRYRLTKPMHDLATPFTKPALIVTGRKDPDVGYRDGWSLVNSYPRATFITMDRATHGLPVDKSEHDLFKALVIDWLARVAESRNI